MKYVIANWKANKTIQEAQDWLQIFTKNDFSLIKDQFHIIICPGLHALTVVKMITDQYVFMSLGSQNISYLPSGAYTGEVSAQMLYGLVDYALIGHSERRSLFHETNESIMLAAKQAKSFGIEPIVCVRNETDVIPSSVKIIMYEPPQSIGSGLNEPLENVLQAQTIIDPTRKTNFIYGGSVNQTNISSYIESESIAGVVIGTASLDPTDFYATIKSACV